MSTRGMTEHHRATGGRISPPESTEVTMTISHPLPIAVDEKTLTLADLLVTLNQRTDIDPTRLRDYRSSVSRMCRLLGSDPAQVPLDFSIIRARLEGVN